MGHQSAPGPSRHPLFADTLVRCYWYVYPSDPTDAVLPSIHSASWITGPISGFVLHLQVAEKHSCLFRLPTPVQLLPITVLTEYRWVNLEQRW